MSYVKVGGDGLSSGSVATSHIQDNAITTQKILDGAITSAKISIDADISANNNKITNIATPISPNDAVNKAYSDALVQGLDIKLSVRLATTSNLALSGIQTIDGILGIAGDRILVKNQTTASENGIYDMAAGAWTRSSDSDSSAKVTASMFTFVEEGSINKDNGFTLVTPDPIVLGTTALTFTQFSGAGSIVAGLALSKTGNTLDVNVDNATLEVIADSLQVKNLGIDGTKLALNSVSETNINNLAVTTAKVANNAIDKTKIAADVAGLGLAQAVGGELDVSVDNSSIEVSVDTLQVKALGITDAMLAGSISDAKLASNYIQTSEVDGTSIEFAANSLNLVAGGVNNTHVASSLITGQTESTIADGADSILIYDNSLTSLRKMTRANFISGIVTGSVGDIQETSCISSNNVINQTKVTGFIHNNAKVRSFKAIVSVEIIATANLYETFEIIGIQKGSIWDISVSSVGDISGINFTTTALGQIQYTSSYVAGYVSSAIKFRSLTTTV